MQVSTQITQVRITGNSIHDNGALGIDLLSPGVPSTGVTLNDAGDADTGGNTLQNFPVLGGATATSTQTAVSGTLNSTPNSTFAMEFFNSPMCDSSGFGEGTTFLGTIDVATDASGNAAFEATFPFGSPAGSVVTATAASAAGNTSEFSACAPVTGGGLDGDANGDGLVGIDDLLMVINGWGPCAVPSNCPGDVDHNGAVNLDDLLMVIINWD